jgi:hypothetical protein
MAEVGWKADPGLLLIEYGAHALRADMSLLRSAHCCRPKPSLTFSQRGHFGHRRSNGSGHQSRRRRASMSMPNAAEGRPLELD